jgi:hypothetical protein
MAEEKSGYGYGKRPLWQWILLYVVIGAVVYGAIYYFFLAKKPGYSYSGTNTPSIQPAPFKY